MKIISSSEFTKTPEQILVFGKLLTEFEMGDKWNESEYQPRSIVEKWYHNNWVRLMPVIKKLDDAAEDNLCPFDDEYSQRCQYMADVITRFYIINDEVIDVVTEFIEWFNKNKF